MYLEQLHGSYLHKSYYMLPSSDKIYACQIINIKIAEI
jgi:hypothetical protein